MRRCQPKFTKYKMHQSSDLSTTTKTLNREPNISNDRQILITLFWMRHYLVEKLLSFILSIGQATISRILHRCVSFLYDVLKDNIKFPSGQYLVDLKRKCMRLAGRFRYLAVVVDGTEIKIPKSCNKKIQKASFSMKKKIHSINVLIIIDLFGKPLH